MRTLLALDLASRSGFTLWTDGASLIAPEIECGSWSFEGQGADEKADLLAEHLRGFLRDCKARGRRVSRSAIERPMETVPMKEIVDRNGRKRKVLDGNPKTFVMQNRMYASARAILIAFGARPVSVPSATWRKAVLGRGRRPKGTEENWFKAEMRKHAGDLALRYGFAVPNHDAADSLGVAIWLAAQGGNLPAGALRRHGPNLFSEAAEYGDA